MAKLYELTENYNNLLELLGNQEVAKEMIEDALNQVGEEIEIKAENIAKLIKTIEVDINGYKEEEKRLSTRRKSLENRATNLKEYLESSMIALDKKTIKGKVFTLAIQKNPSSVEIMSEENIPEQYFAIKKEVVKKDILEALKSGIEVPGAIIKQTESLRIR